MTSKMWNVTVDCQQPWELAQFWSKAIGRPVHPDNEPADEEVGVVLEGGGELIFQRVPEPKTVKNRVHLCLRPDGPRDNEVDWLTGVGATLVDDRRRADGTGWAVMADPEGNEFCVLRSEAELPAGVS
ncbi:MAG: VOC family protein [Mycobacteriales bacterium]